MLPRWGSIQSGEEGELRVSAAAQQEKGSLSLLTRSGAGSVDAQSETLPSVLPRPGVDPGFEGLQCGHSKGELAYT